MTYKDIVAKKIKERDAKFPKEWLLNESELPEKKNVSKFFSETKFLTPLEFEITESPASVILQKIKKSEWTSLEVVKSFAHRATIAHQLVNCLTEVFFEEAYEQARELDAYLIKTGEVKGPLHGLPVSLKDEFNVKGQCSTVGLVSLAEDEPKKEDSPNVKSIRDAGAVLYLKTNVPTGCFNAVAMNNLFGSTTSPFNRSLSSGGSSGGEGALLALKGSPLGIGSDLGGSVRQPSAFQNLFSIKPTAGRVPHESTGVLSGIESIKFTNGPMSTDPEMLEVYLKAVSDSQHWLTDSRVTYMPWKTDIDLINKKLKFAIMWDDGAIRPTAPVKRALKLVEEKLKKAGHEIVEFDLTSAHELGQLAYLLMSSNGCKNLVEELEKSGEPHAGLESFQATLDVPTSMIWDVHAEKTKKVNKIFTKWTELGVDGVISPLAPIAGTKFHNFTDITYSPLPNLLDVPAATFPVLEVDQEKDAELNIGAPRNDWEKKVHSNYNVKELEGGVVGLQVLGRRYEDEKTIQLVKVISKALGTYNYWETRSKEHL